MQIAESSWTMSKRAQTRTQTAFGSDGYPSATKKWAYSIHCSMTHLHTKPSSSFVPSLQDTESLNSISGWYLRPMVATTITGAASALAPAFRDRIKRSPLHIEDGKKHCSSLRQLFQAFEKLSPPERRQKAITPSLLNHLQRVTGQQSVEDDHVVDLVMGFFFFTMRA